MGTKDAFVYGLVRCVKQMWLENCGVRDLTVVVDGEQFKCFRFVLEACSRFFSGLFRSGMKETEFNVVTIGGMTSATFQLILDVLYTSADVITDQTLFDVWHAANQLQIGFLFEECEIYAISILSSDRFEDIYKNAKMLSSSKVLEATIKFITQNFEGCKDKETILKLDDFELLTIAASNELKVSTEDFVIETILKWADYYSDDKRQENAPRAHILADAYISSRSPQTSSDLTNSNSNSLGVDPPIGGKRDDGLNKSKEQQSNAENVSPIFMEILENLKETTDDNTKEKEVALINSELELIESGEIPLASTENTNYTDTATNKNEDELIKSENCSDETKLNEDLASGFFEVYDEHMDEGRGAEDEAVDFHARSSELRQARLQFLRTLFAASRISLASVHYLRRLQNVGLVMEHSDIRDIVVSAILFKTVGGGYGQLPLTAVHRRCSEYVNVAAYVHNDGVKALNFLSKEWYTLPKPLSQCKNVCLTYFRDELFAFLISSRNDITVYVLRAKTLKTHIENQQEGMKTSQCVQKSVFSVNNSPSFVGFGNSIVNCVEQISLFEPSCYLNATIVPHESNFYWLKHADKKLYKLDLRMSANILTEVSTLPMDNVIEHAAAFEDKILVFCDEVKSQSEETVTYCYDVNTRIWTSLNNLEGPAKYLLTFRCAEVTYVLQTTGDLWEIVSLGHGLIDFKHVKKIWDFDFELHGAVTLGNDLYLVGAEEVVNNREKTWPQHPELFKQIHVYGASGNCSNLEACIIPKATITNSPGGNTWVKLDISFAK